jgi:hypothetical protein
MHLKCGHFRVFCTELLPSEMETQAIGRTGVDEEMAERTGKELDTHRMEGLGGEEFPLGRRTGEELDTHGRRKAKNWKSAEFPLLS